ncbi:MAG: alginate export family protein [Acidobacteriota bacterium]
MSRTAKFELRSRPRANKQAEWNRRRFGIGFLFLMLGTLVAVAAPCQTTTAQANARKPATLTAGSFDISGTWRTRSESWDWFEDDTATSTYTFVHSLFWLCVGQSRGKWDWQAEAAIPMLFALPDDAIVPAPQGQLGLGATYFAANNRRQNIARVFLKQGFVRFKDGERRSLRLGRFEFLDGSEVAPKDATLAVMEKTRITQRLIGNFGWSAVGRSYDGIQLTQNWRKNNFTFVAARVTQGVFQAAGMGELDVGFLYGGYTVPFSRKGGDSELRIFGIGYDDPRGTVLKTDNRPLAARQADHQDILLGTFGADYLKVFNTSAAGKFDFLVWGVLQTGSWGSQSDRAGAFVGEFGWQPPAQRLAPWLSAGYSYGSGDGNPNDNEHTTFSQLLPTPRPYARFPFYDMQNNKDLYVTLNLHPHRNVLLRTEAHALSLAERNDLWYLGGGPFQPQTFGYVGRPSGGHSKLANVWDLSVDYKIAPRLSVSFYYAKAWGSRVIENIYPDGKNGQFGYVELDASF